MIVGVVLFGLAAALALLWLGMLLGVGRWGAGHRLEPGARPSAPGLVSVCVPARNEEDNIGACVTAVLAQSVGLELLVVDDGSEDATVSRARQAAAGDARFRLLEAAERPLGWSGKAWALRCAAEEAGGEWLCFVDADVCLQPEALAALLAAAEEHAGLSVFASWELAGFWERVVIPAVGWFIRGAVDLDRVNDPGAPEAFANGQLILVRRIAYDAIGGHEAVKASVLDDVDLARALKGAGHPLRLALAPWAFRVRLYRSLDEIVRGYTKNLYAGMERNPVVGALAIGFVAVAGVLPGVLALSLPVVGRWGQAAAFAGVVALQIAFRYRVERRDGRSGAIAWAHPLANALLCWILFRSVTARQAEWKGRAFVEGRADER